MLDPRCTANEDPTKPQNQIARYSAKAIRVGDFYPAYLDTIKKKEICEPVLTGNGSREFKKSGRDAKDNID